MPFTHGLPWLAKPVVRTWNTYISILQLFRYQTKTLLQICRIPQKPYYVRTPLSSQASTDTSESLFHLYIISYILDGLCFHARATQHYVSTSQSAVQHTTITHQHQSPFGLRQSSTYMYYSATMGNVKCNS